MRNPSIPALVVLGLAQLASVQSRLLGQLSPIGLSEVGAQWFENEIPPGLRILDRDLIESAESLGFPGEVFGSALAVGDFNGDGADDLATGVPGDDDPAVPSDFLSGSVFIRYGNPGARLAGGPPAQVLRQEPGAAFNNERFGEALAAADFDGDGYDDLAVGIPWDGSTGRGAVIVHYGSSSGIAPLDTEFIEEAGTSDPAHVCDGANFGQALAAGDFDADGFADLAIGVPKGCDNLFDLWVPGGSVFVAHGDAAGLLPFVGYRMSLNSFGFDPVEPEDTFGRALAVGDFDADSYADLAIGIPGEGGHGAIQTVMGSQFGLLFADNAYWLPGALGEIPEIDELLGGALAAGDFDGDGHDDLAIGNPSEDLDPDNTVLNVGKIDIAYGAAGPAGFDLARTDRLLQSDIFGGAGSDQGHDRFGAALAAGDFDGDGRDDLAIGQPGEVVVVEQGAVTIVMGSPGGLGLSERFRILWPGGQGVPGVETAIDQFFGAALAVGDFDGTGFADLAIGLPLHDFGAAHDAGAEAVLYGALFADGFEVASFHRWAGWAPLP